MPAQNGSDTNPLTEVSCIYRLQEMVSELSELFCRFIFEKNEEELISKSFLLSYLSENNIIDKEWKINGKSLDNHCRLIALILLVEQTSKHRIKSNKPLLSFLDKAYKKLPIDFRKCLHELSEIVDKRNLKKYYDDLINIFNFPSDIIGIVYNKFVYNSHQQSHGQYFT
ncbi:MAG: hypothetical protein ABI290_01545, partial [Ginsengibacter sp.]